VVPSTLAAGEPAAPGAVLVDAGYRPDVRPLTSLLPRGVRIAGVNVGGLQAATAVEFVRASFEQPLVVVLGERRIRVLPGDVGAVAYARSAVGRALAASPGRKVDLVVTVSGAGVRRFVAGLAASYDRPAKPGRFAMVNFRPTITGGVPGRRLDRSAAAAAVVHALTDNHRGLVRLPVIAVAPTVPQVADTALIVVRRKSNTLELFQGVKLVRRFAVATGQSAYPTPLGTFAIVVKQRNPSWYPPASPWARGELPVPPGPGNPLGTRWMGLSARLVGIHGTPKDGSIGYSQSHGCIRMHIPEAEWLFDHAELGTKVMIVPA
jgi:lipoprotein-anchoring transpeptidase ErfK/SrfK